MTPSLIIKLTILLVLGLLIVWRKSKRNKTNKLISRLSDNSYSSFSLMIIFTSKKTDSKLNLKRLIESSDYEIIEINDKKDTFNNWNDNIYFDTKNIKKGIIELNELTVFNDPESIIITDREKIQKLSNDLNCKILIGVWERVSMTVIYEEYEKGKLLTSTTIIDNKPDNANSYVRQELIDKADNESLKNELIGSANGLKELFDDKELNIIEYTLKDNSK